MLAKIKSVALKGLEAFDVLVEVDVSNGLPSLNIVGLPDEAVQESKERVRSAIKNSGFEYPMKRITVNLAPAELRKEGSTFDLPIALGILLVVEAIKDNKKVNDFYFAGELSLDGTIRRISGALPMAIGLAYDSNSFVVPYENIFEVAIVKNINAYPVKHLKEAVEFLNMDRTIEPVHKSIEDDLLEEVSFEEDFSDIKGQFQAKRSLEIASAGGHNVVMVGSPGSGKTLLARRVPTILPPLTEKEALEVTQIYSVSSLLMEEGYVKRRPFRSPHHTASGAAIIGGGNSPKPGEISLAHNGVLFFDELPEFRRDVLEALRQPMEDGFVSIARVKERITYPSRFMLVAAMNPCPCGWYGDPVHPCSCTVSEIKKYRAKVSGPLWDRFDIQVEVPRLLPDELAQKTFSESSKNIRERVVKARKIQAGRYKNKSIFSNSQLSPRAIKEFISLREEERSFLSNVSEKFSLTGRGYDRVLKVARTIADLEGSEDVRLPHIAEAVQYRIDNTI
jgi:magnesium chelatase family protein